MDRRSAFLGLRWVAIAALTLHLAYSRAEPLWADVKVWSVVLSLVLSNLALTVVRPSLFTRHRLYFYTFLLDLLLVSVAVYMADAQSISFLVVLLLCILSGAISGNLKASFLFSGLASLMYLGQLRVELPSFGQMLDPSTLLRVPLLVVFALTAGSLSARADRRPLQRAELLLEFDRRLATHKPPDEIALALVELLREKTGLKRAAFYLLNDGTRAMRRIGHPDLPPTLHLDQMPDAVRDRLLGELAVYPEHLRGEKSWCHALGLRPAATFFVPAAYSSRAQGLLVAEYHRRVLEGEHLGGLLRQLADRAASALINARLIQTAQESAIGLHSLLKMSEAVSASLSIPRILGLLEECCCRLMKVRSSKIFLAGGGDQLMPVGGPASALEQAAANAALERQEPVVLAGPEEIAKLGGFAAANDVTNLVAMPLRSADGVMGVVEAVDKPEPFSSRDLALLSGLAGQAAVALEKARLYENMRDRAERIEGLAHGIEKEKHKLEHVLANMEDGVVLLEPGGVTLANHAGRRLLRPNGPAMLPAAISAFADPLGILARLDSMLDGEPPKHEIIPDGDRYLILQAVRLRPGRSAAIDDTSQQTVDLAHVQVEVRGADLPAAPAPLTSVSAAEPTAVIAVIRDITDVVRLGEKRTEFVSHVSHELRTPLSAIIGAVKLLIEGRAGELSETQTRLVGIMEKESQHLMGLIGDLLDLAKLDAGSMEIQLRDVDLAELMEDAVGSLGNLAADKSIRLTVGSADTPDMASCDPLRIRQVLLNLLGNAIKFTPEGGHVHVESVREPERFIVRVIDNGPGIPPDKQSTIFDKFEQLGPSESRAGGTGLGLAISRRIIEGHRGTIGVASEPGVGSTFYFTLPSELAFEQPAARAA